jgi:hypothetical protein
MNISGWGFKHLNIPAEQYEVYAEFGYAAEKCQLLELEAGNLALSYLAFFIDPKRLSEEERATFKAIFQSVTEDLNKKTFGTLLSYIRKSMTFEDSMLKTMDEALQRRNYLTHHFFRTHNFAFFSESGRKSMIDELHEIQGKLDSALGMLGIMTTLMEKFAGREVPEGLAMKFQMRGEKLNL